MDLGITKRSGFTTEETARINDLAGTGTKQKTKYLLLKNGNAVPVPYHITGAADLHVNDIILRRVPAPAPPPVESAARPRSRRTPSPTDLPPPTRVASACARERIGLG